MAVIDWTTTGLMPTDGLVTWHLFNPNTSTGGFIADASGNGYDVEQVTTPPALTYNAHAGRPGWFFDGTANPLKSAGFTENIKHSFVFASATGAAFDLNRGLLSGLTSGDLLTSESSGTQFFSFGADYDYRKSDTDYADDSMEAPLNERPELLEVMHLTTGVDLDGWQIGQQKATTARKWKGYFYESVSFNRILSQTERLRVMLYFNIKYAAWTYGMPLIFPNKEMLTDTNIVAYARFDDEEPDYDQITDTFEYADGGEDYNEVASTAPQTWEIVFTIAESSAAQAFAYREIFEGFYRQARKANPFYFTDKWGDVWSGIRIEDYRSRHSAHKSWNHEITFKLRGDTEAINVTNAFGGFGNVVEGEDYVVE